MEVTYYPCLNLLYRTWWWFQPCSLKSSASLTTLNVHFCSFWRGWISALEIQKFHAWMSKTSTSGSPRGTRLDWRLTKLLHLCFIRLMHHYITILGVRKMLLILASLFHSMFLKQTAHFPFASISQAEPSGNVFADEKMAARSIALPCSNINFFTNITRVTSGWGSSVLLMVKPICFSLKPTDQVSWITYFKSHCPN